MQFLPSNQAFYFFFFSLPFAFPMLKGPHNAGENEISLPSPQATQWRVKWLEATRNDEIQKFSLYTEQSVTQTEPTTLHSV